MSTVLDPMMPLREFIVAVTRAVERIDDEPELLSACRPLLARLLSHDGWLPEAFAQPGAETYRQYLLYCDPLERFSVVSFVWGPGQKTPVHNHTIWGLVGVLRGSELCSEYARINGRIVHRGAQHTMKVGMIEAVSPTLGDWHLVQNALVDQSSISIHLYGGNIGAVRRQMLDSTGAECEFVSGYSSPVLPNVWDRSVSVRALQS